jgi:putative flippase GtrA
VGEPGIWRRGSALWRFSVFRFIAVGISNTLVGLSVIYLCWAVLGWSDVASNITGYVVGLAWSFGLHRRLTFRADTAVAHGLVRYVIVCLLAYGLNLQLVVWTRQLLGPDSFLPHVVGNGAYSVFVYMACRWFVFRPAAA